MRTVQQRDHNISSAAFRWLGSSIREKGSERHRRETPNTQGRGAAVRTPLAIGLALGLIASIAGECRAAEYGSLQGKGTLRVCAANPRYFTDSSGKAIYFTAAHTWTNLPDIGLTDPPPVFDYDAYLKFLTDHNYNYIRLWRWETPKDIEDDGIVRYSAPHPWKRTGPGTAWDGKPKFDLNTFDEQYFARMRKRVEAASDRGIYVSVMLFNGWELQFSNWNDHPFNLQNNINGVNGDPKGTGRGVEVQSWPPPADVDKVEKAYVRKVIDTVNGLDNVLYEISNESAPASTDWQYAMIEYIKSYESGKPKQHPVGMSFQYLGGSNSTLVNSPADWVSPNPDSRTGAYSYRDNPPPGDGKKVVLSDTDHLWGNGGDRQWVWKSFLRGLNPLYMDPYLDPPIWERLLPNREEVLRNMGYARTYANRVDLSAMTPNLNVSSTKYCLANVGVEYVVYKPDAAEFTVDLVAGEYAYEWFNPVTGTKTAAESIAAEGGRKFFHAPFAGDAVLYLKRVPAR
jgi:hypothetical protein